MERLSRRIRVRSVLIILFVVLGGLSACGDDSPEQASDVTAEDATASAEEDDATARDTILDAVEDPAEQEELVRGQETVPDDREPAADDTILEIREGLLAGSWELVAGDAADALSLVNLSEQQRAEITGYQQLAVAQIAADAEATQMSVILIAEIDEEFAGQVAAVAIGEYLLAENWAATAALSAKVLESGAIGGEERDELTGYQMLAEAWIDDRAVGVTGAFEMIEEANPALAERLASEGVFDFRVDAEVGAATSTDGG